MSIEVTLIYIFTVILCIIPIAYLIRIIYELLKMFNVVTISVKPLNEIEKTILKNEFKYYNLLSVKGQKKFERKVSYFMNNKEFIPKKMEHVTREMRVLISAAFVQLTFGLPLLKFPHFKQILVFPSGFYNKRTRRKHIGEVNTRGLIAFSWEHFMKGYTNTTDGRNVALHEMAHALRFEDAINNDEHSFLDISIIRQIYIIYKEQKYKDRHGEGTFLRKYAYTNEQEFFAVAIEAFFEQSVTFKTELPVLYKLLIRLLKQDPILVQKRGVTSLNSLSKK